MKNFIKTIYRLVRKSYSSLYLGVNCIKKNILFANRPRFSSGTKLVFKGSNVYVGFNCHVGTNIFMESNVLVASNVSFVGGDHEIYNPDRLMFYSGRAGKKGVIIGSDVWIGHGSTVLDGVSISTGTVVAAGSVVTKSFPPFSIIGGSPAKLLKMRFEGDNLLKYTKMVNQH
jgi:acetyltransferase-like isoleucine patch superfamily enzyme